MEIVILKEKKPSYRASGFEHILGNRCIKRASQQVNNQGLICHI